MAINSREKGNRFEREVAKDLTNWLGMKFGRTPGSGAFSTNTNDKNLAGDVYTYEGNFPFVIECKFYKDYNLLDILNNANMFPKWIAQARREADAVGKKVMLVVKKNYSNPIVMIELDKDPENIDFFKYKNYYIFQFKHLKDILPEYV